MIGRGAGRLSSRSAPAGAGDSRRVMVFHHPAPLASHPRSGSSVRPVRMRAAFRSLGFDVIDVVGHAAVRARAAREVARYLEGGGRADLAYSESTTLPMLLTEPHHLPLHPLVDFGLFRALRRAEVPLGLFYRDAHWRIPEWRARVALWRRAVTLPFYRYDGIQLRRLLTRLFVPSAEMIDALPPSWRRMPWAELPPGCELHEVEGHSHEGGSLRLLYVGGVTPPVYDLSPLFAVAQSVPEAEVRLVCRREEWRTTRDRYPELPNVRVSHLDANDLPSLYCDADLFALLLEPVSYLGLARPVKLFESLGFGLPILTIGDTLSSRWVAAEGVGWSVRDTSEAVRVVDRLREERAEILAKRKRALEIRAQHSWSRRAEAVVGALVEDGAP